MKKASAIICVYNEESTIKNVVLSVSRTLIINEIIIINDGSTDQTKSIIEELHMENDITTMHFQENKGKGYAMATGIENATNEIVVFIDADQTKIPDNYINKLVKPLLNGQYDMVLGYTTVKFLGRNINPMKILTGERAIIKKDIESILDKIKESRFGVETLLYLYYTSKNKKIKFTHLHELKHKDKYKKSKFIKATKDYFQEAWEITYTAIKNRNLIMKSIKHTII